MYDKTLQGFGTNNKHHNLAAPDSIVQSSVLHLLDELLTPPLIQSARFQELLFS